MIISNKSFRLGSEQSTGLAKGQGLLTRIAAIVIAAVAVGVSLVFSLVVFSFLLIAGLVVGGFFWWKTRAFRRQMREQMQAARASKTATGQGTVIDGDYIHEASKPGESEPR